MRRSKPPAARLYSTASIETDSSSHKPGTACAASLARPHDIRVEGIVPLSSQATASWVQIRVRGVCGSDLHGTWPIRCPRGRHRTAQPQGSMHPSAREFSSENLRL